MGSLPLYPIKQKSGFLPTVAFILLDLIIAFVVILVFLYYLEVYGEVSLGFSVRSLFRQTIGWR